MFRKAIPLALWVALIGLVAAPAVADTWPAKTIHFVVGFPPGGSNDILARLFGQKLSERLGQTVIVENKPGANAIIASEYVAKAAPDGYTLLIGATGQMTVNPGIYDKLPYDSIRDFAPVTMLAVVPVVMAAHPSLPARTLAEVVALAKAEPGSLNMATGSTPFQMVGELFKGSLGLNIGHVPYKGSAQAIASTLSGETKLVVVDLSPALAYLQTGKLRGIAIAGPDRTPALPDVPSSTEAGYPQFALTVFTGLFAPAGTPPAIIERLHHEVVEILALPDIKERLAQLAMEPGGQTPAAAAEMVRAERVKWTKVAKDAGIKAD